jgi:hypothetical protein
LETSVLAISPKVKYPTEILTYSMAFNQVLQSGETLSSVTSVSEPTSTLELSNQAVTSQTILDDDGNQLPAATAVTFTVSGGLDQVDYRIIVTVTTSTGNTRVGVGVLQVRTGNLY